MLKYHTSYSDGSVKMAIRRSWNELKRAILTKMQASAGLTSHDISIALDINIPNAGMTLLKLYRQRLVSRYSMSTGKFRKPLYRYEITDRGLNRLLWYEQKEEVSE